MCLCVMHRHLCCDEVWAGGEISRVHVTVQNPRVVGVLARRRHDTEEVQIATRLRGVLDELHRGTNTAIIEQPQAQYLAMGRFGSKNLSHAEIHRGTTTNLVQQS